MPLSDRHFYLDGWGTAASQSGKAWIKPLAGAPKPILLVDPEPDPCSEGQAAIGMTVDEASTSADSLRVGDVVEVTGIFDHPAADGCIWVSFLGRWL